jgi:integrase
LSAKQRGRRNAQLPKRTVLMTAYRLGLRVGELCRLRVSDVDGHADRMCLRILQGKGAKGWLRRHLHVHALDEQVRLRVRGNDSGRRSIITIDGNEFVARLLQHVLPPGFKRIRHYGLLAPAAKRLRMEAARRLLGMPQPNDLAMEDAHAFMRRISGLELLRCGRCASGHLQLLCERPADRSALAHVPPQVCRGPP